MLIFLLSCHFPSLQSPSFSLHLCLFVFSLLLFFPLLLVIRPFFYFCRHMLSQLLHSPSLLPLCVFAVLKIKLSYLSVILGYMSSDTCTLAHAPAEECLYLLHPPSFLPRFRSYSPPPWCSAHCFKLPNASCFFLYPHSSNSHVISVRVSL